MIREEEYREEGKTLTAQLDFGVPPKRRHSGPTDSSSGKVRGRGLRAILLGTAGGIQIALQPLCELNETAFGGRFENWVKERGTTRRTLMLSILSNELTGSWQ